MITMTVIQNPMHDHKNFVDDDDGDGGDVTKSGSFGVICEKLPSTVFTGLVLSTSWKKLLKLFWEKWK